MGRRIALLLVTGALAVAAAPAAQSVASDGPVAYAACKRATIGGQSKCIARGQYCARQYQRDYLRYGLSCSKLDARGRYHLR